MTREKGAGPLRPSPCRDPSEGGRAWQRYEELGLPNEWIDSCRRTTLPLISPDEYFWTGWAFFEGVTEDDDLLGLVRQVTGGCFWDLDLEKQAGALGVPFQGVHASNLVEDHASRGTKRGVAEAIVFDHLQGQGWCGSSDGGHVFHLAMSCVEDQMASATYSWPPSQRVMTDQAKAKLTRIVESLDKLRLIHWITGKPWCRQRDIDCLEQSWPLVEACDFYHLCELSYLGYSRSSAGWPDVTLKKSAELRAVEVKRPKDALRETQLCWIRNVGIPLGWNPEIWRVDLR